MTHCVTKIKQNRNNQVGLLAVSAWTKGQSGNPLGRRSDKPFADALRLELAAAGDNHKKLRKIARNLLNLASSESTDALPAILAVADRLDGKPAQESMVTVEKRDATDWSIGELVAFLREETADQERTAAPGGRTTELN
jgi:hypothetical protein